MRLDDRSRIFMELKGVSLALRCVFGIDGFLSNATLVAHRVNRFESRLASGIRILDGVAIGTDNILLDGFAVVTKHGFAVVAFLVLLLVDWPHLGSFAVNQRPTRVTFLVAR